jgi:allantoicase
LQFSGGGRGNVRVADRGVGAQFTAMSDEWIAVRSRKSKAMAEAPQSMPPL